MHIKDLIERQKNNDKVAIIYGNRDVSYRELHNKVLAASQNLLYEGMGHHVGLFIHNSVNYILGYFAISFTSKVIVPINPGIKAMELKCTIEYCELRTIVSDSVNIGLLRKNLEEYKYKIRVFNIETMTCEYFGGQAVLPVSGDNETEDIALMLHTSGSLSSPKRVMLTNTNLISCAESIIESLDITEEDRTLIALPLFLASANTSQMLTHIYLGASIVIMDALFTAGYFFKLVEKHKVTNFTGVPTMMTLLADNKNSKGHDISSLRFICFGGAPTPVHVIKQLIMSFPQTAFIHMYGQTEASTRISHLLPDFQLSKISSVGKPIPGVQLRLVNEAGNDVAEDEVGEVAIKGRNVMKGYFKRDELTKQTIKNGWLYTGDLGRYDAEGFLYIVGRKKNVIIKGGMNIYPEEIEEILKSYPAIKEACVSAEKHDLFGEVPVARVVLNDSAGAADEEEIKRFCLENMSSYKIPERITVVSELPTTETGKMIRFYGGRGIMEQNIDMSLKEIIVKYCIGGITCDDINEDTDLINDLGFDSISILRFLAETQNTFDIEIEDEYLSLEMLGRYGNIKEAVLTRIKCTG